MNWLGMNVLEFERPAIDSQIPYSFSVSLPVNKTNLALTSWNCGLTEILLVKIPNI